MKLDKRIAALLLLLPLGALPAAAAEQDAIDGCIDQMRKVGGPDAANGGEVLSSDFSEAGTLVMLKDAGGTVWRCIGYNDGTVGDLAVTEAADDGNGAMAGASTASSSAPETWTERVKFAHGKSSAEFEEQMFAGGAGRYVLGAKNGQFLEVDIRAFGPDVYYRIISPDKSSLLDPIISDKPYKGQLWQSGDHVVEVINRGDKDVGFQIRISIE